MDANTVITGGGPLSVTDTSGNTHEVLVRLLRIKEFPEYFQLADQEEALAAFVTGKDDEFVNSLTTDAVLEICEVAHDLNFHNACRWATRRANFTEALLPVAEKGKRMERALGASAPPAPSPSEKP